MDAHFCLETVDEALSRYGRPEIFNTDQESQFTSEAFTSKFKENHIRISMDGKGSWRDNASWSASGEPSSMKRSISKPIAR